jgi:hypothetical protein
MNETDENPETRDPGLEALFRRTSAEPADESFVAATMRRVEAAKTRRRIGRYLIEGAVLIGIVAASPWLIDGSVRLSDLLDMGLTRASDWLGTPAGMAIGVAIVAAVLALRPLLALWAPLARYRAARLNRFAPRPSVPDPGRRDNPDPG